MNYKIQVEGGFMGISKVYQGSLDLSSDEMDELIALMELDFKKDEYLRDGLIYNVELSDENHTLMGVFDEKNVPKIFRALMSE